MSLYARIAEVCEAPAYNCRRWRLEFVHLIELTPPLVFKPFSNHSLPYLGDTVQKQQRKNISIASPFEILF